MKLKIKWDSTSVRPSYRITAGVIGFIFLIGGGVALISMIQDEGIAYIDSQFKVGVSSTILGIVFFNCCHQGKAQLKELVEYMRDWSK